MKDKNHCIKITNNESSSTEKNINITQTENREYNSNFFFNPGVSEKVNNTIYNKNLPNQYNIISYYFSTMKNILNTPENLNFLLYNQNSRNFVRKSMMNSLNRIDSYTIRNSNINYINNLAKYNNCINNFKYNYYFANENETNQFDNYSLNYKIDNKIMNKSQICNNSINCFKNKNSYIVNNKTNNYCDLSYVNFKLNKNIINEIDYPPFIPSKNHKKENDKNNNKNDSISKDKESDSTSALSEQKKEDNNEESMKSKESNKIINNSDDIKNNDYLVEMFGKKGWICKLCNNFNYESRLKCNRCGITKMPKTIIEIKSKVEEEHKLEGGWICNHCKNLNYSFRKICNRCKLPKATFILQNKIINFMDIPFAPGPSSVVCFNNGKMFFYNNNN